MPTFSQLVQMADEFDHPINTGLGPTLFLNDGIDLLT